MVVGCTTGLAMFLFVHFSIAHPFFIVFHAVAASLLMALLGILTGIWAEKFDHLAAITNFIVTPLSFLSGTFYSTTRLPEVWQHVAHLNPFFYMIDRLPLRLHRSRRRLADCRPLRDAWRRCAAAAGGACVVPPRLPAEGVSAA